MVARQFDFTAFIDTIKDLPMWEMLQASDRALLKAENQSRRHKEAATFAEEVGDFIFFLKTGTKPLSVSEFNWPLYRTPIANLVQRGQMKRSALSPFEGVRK